MSKTVISVESTCDLTEKHVAEYGIALINMEYSVDGDIHMMGDGAYTNKQFYCKMREGSVTKTSQINEFRATEHLRSILSTGADVIHIAFSSSLSGTYGCFVAAADALKDEFPNAKIAIVDSLCACAGQGLLTVEVAEYLKSHTFEETVEYAESIKHNVNHLFVVDDLKYLARGGRISKATALLGNTIHMKPVMHMNNKGELVAFKKVLSRKKSMLTLVDLTAQRFSKDGNRIYIAHADCIEDAQFVAERVEKLTGVKSEIMDLGMVIGSHSGPGTLAVFFVGELRA